MPGSPQIVQAEPPPTRQPSSTVEIHADETELAKPSAGKAGADKHTADKPAAAGASTTGSRDCAGAQRSDEIFFAEYPKNQDIVQLNARLDERDPIWSTVAAALVLNALGGAGESVESLAIEYMDARGEATTDNPSRARVVAVTTPRFDESVAHVRYTFVLVATPEESTTPRWRYASLRAEYLCRPGRGAQSYSNDLCR
ncbi:MAG TPA: hypothetical protein VLC09_11450 [Polyangiaceae bacterium]|nr:hypothetical protein [Polyangiaceae bacterium]